MKTYHHFSKDERRILAVLLNRGESLRQIAKTLHRSPSTLSRELQRNLTERHYHPLHSEFLARARKRECHRGTRLKNDDLKRLIETGIRLKWSPEIVAGRINAHCRKTVVCKESIYQWIYLQARHLIPCLPRKHPTRGFRRIDRSKTMILGRVSVNQRPKAANLRLEPGHWEADLVIGKGRSVLKVAVERKTRFTRLVKAYDKSAQASFLALKTIFSSVPAALRRSVTYDNGTENVLHREINSLFNLNSFFCYPGHCWEKPTVENTNGLIRWFLPKRTNLDIISDQQILAIENWLNSRPRKCLNFLTPAEALHQASVALTP